MSEVEMLNGLEFVTVFIEWLFYSPWYVLVGILFLPPFILGMIDGISKGKEKNK